jgi:hypothetical protein
MGRQLTSVALILLVLICPYNCIGASCVSSSDTSECGDRCCPPKDDSSSPGSTPEPSDPSCDGSCKNCLCGGAVTDESLSDLQVPNPTAFDLYLPQSVCNHRGTSVADRPTHYAGESPPARTGAIMRALYQSFLL